MTKTVQKITLDLRESLNPIIELPVGNQFLSLQIQEYDSLNQKHTPGIVIFDSWWGVNTENDIEEIQLYVRETGQEVPPSVTYLSSAVSLNREFHVFQKDAAVRDMHIVDGKFVPLSQ